MVSSVYSFSTVRWLETHNKTRHDVSKKAEKDTLVDNLRELFDWLDTNGSGTIELSEVMDAISSYNSSKEKVKLKELFTKTDTDQSGSVDFEELVAVMREGSAFQLRDQQKQELWRLTFSRFSSMHTRDNLIKQIKNDSGELSDETRYAAFHKLFNHSGRYEQHISKRVVKHKTIIDDKNSDNSNNNNNNNSNNNNNNNNNTSEKANETLVPKPPTTTQNQHKNLRASKHATNHVNIVPPVNSIGAKRRSLLLTLRHTAHVRRPTGKFELSRTDVDFPRVITERSARKPEQDVCVRARATVSAALSELENMKSTIPQSQSANRHATFTLPCRPKKRPHPRLLGSAQSSRRGIMIQRHARREARKYIGAALIPNVPQQVKSNSRRLRNVCA